jgi:predicted DNA-binding transcriptional regulator YafY
MRAARILNMLLVLQHRGRTTAAALSTELEVSERTVLRDVAALGEAGVPIYTVQGHDGGIELLDGFETRLTGMELEEASALFLAGQPEVAHRLGLGVPARTARQKLVSALSPAAAMQAEHLSNWFIHDPDPWAGNPIPHGELRRIADCIERQRWIELTLDATTMTFAPYGLVLKAGEWFAVGSAGDEIVVQSLLALRATRITRRDFARPADFDLAELWATELTGTNQRVSSPR